MFRKVDIAIQWISVNKTNHFIDWIVIYPVDSVIHLSNSPGQLYIKKYFDIHYHKNVKELFSQI